jgi:hypothetical protein
MQNKQRSKEFGSRWRVDEAFNMVVRGGGSNSEDYVVRNLNNALSALCSFSRIFSVLNRGYRDSYYESDPRKATIHDLLDIIATDTKEKERIGNEGGRYMAWSARERRNRRRSGDLGCMIVRLIRDIEFTWRSRWIAYPLQLIFRVRTKLT